MSHRHRIEENFRYARELLLAGMQGIQSGERLMMSSDSRRQITTSARHALKAAVVGGSLVLLASTLTDHRRVRVARIFACSSIAFCADLLWNTRAISSQVLDCAEREIANVRDQHWLESHPIDYA